MPSLHPLLSQCDPAGRRPVKTGDQQIIIVARSAPQIPHCTGGGIRSDGGSSARSGCAKRRAAGECRGRLRTLPSRHSRSGAIFCAATAQSFVPAQGEPPSDPDRGALRTLLAPPFVTKRWLNPLLAGNAQSEVRDAFGYTFRMFPTLSHSDSAKTNDCKRFALRLRPESGSPQPLHAEGCIVPPQAVEAFSAGRRPTDDNTTTYSRRPAIGPRVGILSDFLLGMAGRL